MASIDFVYDKDIAIEKIRTLLSNNDFKIVSETDINNGCGYKFSCIQKLGVIIYFKAGQSTKIVLENASDIVEKLFIKNESFMEEISPTIDRSVIRINVSASFKVSKKNFDNVKAGILVRYPNAEVREDIPKTLYQLKIYKQEYSLTVTQYLTGSILIQGADSAIVDDVKEIINSYDKISIEDNALTFVPEENKAAVKKVISDIPTKFPQLCKDAKSKLSNELYEYLFISDQMQIISALGVMQAVKESNVVIPLYNPVIYPFSKVFEGFIIKMMLEKNAFTYEQYKEDPEIANIGNFVRKKKFDKYIKDKKRDGSVSSQLEIVWDDLRCHELHSDPARNQSIKDLESIELAENKIGEICACMLNAYRIIIVNGFNDEEILKNNKQSIEPENNSIREIKEIPTFFSRIGTDESGKGDYFGPLVIAGVFADQSDEKALLEIGVQDSKKNTDNKNMELANKIWKLLGKKKISVVGIMPEKYNLLYEKMGNNLNNILGWGHARAIENLLENNVCKNAIADQFGNEQVIKDALLEKGKSIDLFQTPKAERDIVVAAASIVARCRYLETLAKLSTSVEIALSKGASSEVENQARAIIAKLGSEALAQFAKLHFKTTKKILGD